MKKHSRAEHYARMMKDVEDEIRDDCYKCFEHKELGIHFTQFADLVIDDGGGAYTKERWEQEILPLGITLCHGTPEREQRFAALCAESNRQLAAKTAKA
jgi:hypothetical protein